MNSLAVEILEKILEYLAEYTHPNTERFPLLTAKSKNNILSARRISRGFCGSAVLRQLFFEVLEQHPFVRVDYAMPELEALSLSEYAADVTMLSVSGIVVLSENAYGCAPLWSDDLVAMLSRFPKLKQLRYYPVTPRYLGGKWETDTNGDMEYNWDPPKNSGHIDRTDVTSMNGLSGWNQFLEAAAKLPNVSEIAMPLCGNRATWCAVGVNIPNITIPHLKRLSINIADIDGCWNGSLSFLSSMPNLDFLEVAVCRALGQQMKCGSFRVRTGSGIEPIKLSKVREFRFMADASFIHNAEFVLVALLMFPNLQHLRLGHLALYRHHWGRLLTYRRVRRLDTLWLLNPSFPVHDPVTRKISNRTYDPEEVALRTVNLVRVTSPWEHGNRAYARAYLGSDWDYAGFHIFDMGK